MNRPPQKWDFWGGSHSFSRGQQGQNLGESILEGQEAYSERDVCAIICALNAEATIRRVIQAIQTSGIQEIIVVDGQSTDQTAAISRETGAKVVSDSGAGLAAARALGAKENRLPVTFFVGPDNVVSRELVQNLLLGLNSSEEIVACGCLTKLEGSSYLSRGLTLILQTLVRPGFASTLGTPTLVLTQILRDFPYDLNRRFSDDTELFERIRRSTGKKFWVTNHEVLEIGTSSLRHAVTRWGYYGISDFENFEASKFERSKRRKLKSVLHPITKQLWQTILKTGPARGAFFLPVFTAMTLARYAGWLQELLRKAR